MLVNDYSAAYLDLWDIMTWVSQWNKISIYSVKLFWKFIIEVFGLDALHARGESFLRVCGGWRDPRPAISGRKRDR